MLSKISLEDLTKKYTRLIGSGGYGDVKTGTDYPNNKHAVKFLHLNFCSSSEKEYKITRDIYLAYEKFLICKNVPAISVVKPIGFIQNTKSIYANGNIYDCAFIMERLLSPLKLTVNNAAALRNKNELNNYEIVDYSAHLSMNGMINSDQINSLIFVNDQENRPRGFFLNSQKIESIIRKNDGVISSLEDITYRFGVLYGIVIFGAEKIPTDIEFLLTVGKDGYTVTMIDFGLVENFQLSTSNYENIGEEIITSQEINLYYYPDTEDIPIEKRDKCRKTFIKGFTEAFNCFNKNNKFNNLYKFLLNKYNSIVI